MTTVEQNALSLDDFRATARETIDRLNRTGEAETLTIDGEPRAVLVTPAVYAEWLRLWQLEIDVKNIRQGLKEIAEGKGKSVDEVFDPIRKKLLAMQAAGLTRAPAE